MSVELWKSYIVNSLEQKTSRPKLTLAMQNARMDYLSVLVPFDRCLLVLACPAAAALVRSKEREVAWIETFFQKMFVFNAGTPLGMMQLNQVFLKIY